VVTRTVRRVLVPGLLLFAVAAADARGQPPPQRGVDVLSYGFQIVLPDTGQTLRASATVVFRRDPTASDTLALDLVGLDVDSVGWHGAAGAGLFTRHRFTYDGRALRVALPPRDDSAPDNVVVFYHGVPSDGLLLQRDARGRRTAFADDWPERARHWLPTVDEPSDKAEVLWLVGAPAGWRVVANGRLARHGRSPGGRTWWAYEEHHPIPTYTMVIGAGALTLSEHRPAVFGADTIPIEVWAEPEDSAFADSVPFRRATAIVEVLQRLVGRFPYEKLAHVESSTRYGGMENASAIFYAEQGYVGRRMSESVVRHETAHQWFGDAVTERDFHHLWLSEGFATYFDLVVGAALDGDSVLEQGMRRLARVYLQSAVVGRPVLDTTVTTLTDLLDANSYQKGAWVLHMLRGMVGDSAFFRGIRDYYRTYRDSSVLSADFQRVMERASDRRLGWFFDEWLRQPGYPQLDVAWHADRGAVGLDVRQVQPVPWGRYRMPAVPLEFLRRGRVIARRTFELLPQEAPQRLSFDLGLAPDSVAVDPAGTVLLTARVVP
jgi:aminopeptidase N